MAENSAFVDAISDAAYHVLDVPFTKLGAKIEARRRAQGVYPPNEIYIPSPEDSQDCFQQYTEDVARRQALSQLKPAKMSMLIPTAACRCPARSRVMKINGLLCKVIFDHNPTNEFYVEESFPLDWMYPYETPSGIIMKINRHPVLSLLRRRLTRKTMNSGANIPTGSSATGSPTTPASRKSPTLPRKFICGNNYAGFKGDRKFVRDDDAQKAFSKLRSSIAGMYAWRLGRHSPPEYRPENPKRT